MKQAGYFFYQQKTDLSVKNLKLEKTVSLQH